MAIKFNAPGKIIEINNQNVWNDEGEGKTGLKADKVDDLHANEIQQSGGGGYSVEIISTNGDRFRPGQVSTVLTARVWQGQIEITDILNSTQFRWTRTSSDPAADEIWNQNHYTAGKSIAVDSDDMYIRATFTCEILDS
jgi:hypothetical protein